VPRLASGAVVDQSLSEVVPWGRSLAEYVGMFDLTAGDLNRRILDCAAGPASFAAELVAVGGRGVACDPLYRFPADRIAARVEETCPVILSGVEADLDRFVWTRFASPAHLGEARLAAMRRFLADFAAPRTGRYVAASLPALPFADGAFDLALCSHFLFLYSGMLSAAFHVAAIEELLRVARQVRIFPLLDLAGAESAHLAPTVAALWRLGCQPGIRDVPYEFQRGGNQMLTVAAP
jgi:SAM-dependent methyltransferase